MIYNKHLSEPWFSLIKLGLKKCEGRLNKGDFAKMIKGDYIVFYNNDFGFTRKVKCRITSTCNYSTFEEYLTNEGIDKCLPGFDNVKDGLYVYFKYFTKKEETQYGVVVTRLKVINN